MCEELWEIKKREIILGIVAWFSNVLLCAYNDIKKNQQESTVKQIKQLKRDKPNKMLGLSEKFHCIVELSKLLDLLF